MKSILRFFKRFRCTHDFGIVNVQKVHFRGEIIMYKCKKCNKEKMENIVHEK